ncbi:MAG: glycosyltransferase [Alphaproteobacteria bacterium]
MNEQPAKQTTQPRIAVLIPCREEAVAVAAVVGEFRAALPEATIYVYDNGSTDETASIARAAAGSSISRRSRRNGCAPT